MLMIGKLTDKLADYVMGKEKSFEDMKAKYIKQPEPIIDGRHKPIIAPIREVPAPNIATPLQTSVQELHTRYIAPQEGRRDPREAPNWDPREVGAKAQEDFQGWELLGVIEYSPLGVQITGALNKEIPSNYLVNPQKCDYCKRDLYRRYTFIVRNKQTQTIKQLGSHCVKGFFKEWTG